MYRMLAVIGALFALGSMFLCVVALNWMWSLKKPVTEKTNQAFQKADEVLAMAEKTVDNVKGNLEESRTQLMIVRTSVGDGEKEVGFFERAVARSAAKQVSPNVNDVQHSLERVTEASIVVNSILESLHDLEGVENFDNNQVRDLQSKLDGVTRASLDLGDLLDDPRRAKGESALQRSERIVANLDLVIQLAVEFQKGVAALRMKVQYYRSKSNFWIERGPIYISAGLGWVMISQAVVLAVAIRGLTHRKPPTSSK
jgi:hypothetical protein